MDNVLLVVHLLVALAMIGVVLLQRSEGGGLGIGGGGGGGGGMGGFLTGRGTANLLTRATAILAAAFMVTSLTLSILPAPAGRSRPRFSTTCRRRRTRAVAGTDRPQCPGRVNRSSEPGHVNVRRAAGGRSGNQVGRLRRDE